MGDVADGLVNWHAWGPEAFAAADHDDALVLLWLSAPWCTRCREMDEETFGDPRVAAHIRDGFVPVRVDADRRPQVRERYNMGGFPSTVFLTPEGKVVTGATYLGPEGMRQVLERVRETWEQKGREIGRIPRALRDPDPPAGEVTDEVEAHMTEQIGDAFDEEFGGWGSGAKFPLARTIEYALKRDRDRGARTLEALRTHLYDTYDGGFYRYAGERDWSDPRREKLLDENAALVRAFATGYLYTSEDSYREIAEGAVDYLTTTLWTGEAFAGSQEGGDYFTLGAADRQGADPPPVDGTVFADRNGLAAEALLRLDAFAGHEAARRYAERALGYLRGELINDDGAIAHYAPPDRDDVSPEATLGAAELPPPERGLLVDQARGLAGLTALTQVTGDGLNDARRVADYTLDRLRAPEGAFFDGPRSGPGLLDRPLRPLDTTVDLVNAFLDLSRLSGEARYREAAGGALSVFAGARKRMGVEVAGYATACARYLDPLVVETPPAGSTLHRAALRVADHEKVIVPGDREAAVVIHEGGRARAETPQELVALILDGE